jgi:hypothetical protein
MSKRARDHAALLADLAGLSTKEILDSVAGERVIPVPTAAHINSLSVDTYKRKHGGTIVKVSDKRVGVKLRDALAIAKPLDDV